MPREMDKVYNPKNVEDRIYQEWEEKGYFKPEVNPNHKTFTIIMPPPNVTGQLHMGHAFDETLQDVLVRYHRMLGDTTLWIPGMDHASIATEVKVVDKLREEEGVTKEEIGREEFLSRAWDWANEYKDTIRNQLKKLGTSCDWDRERFTMDKSVSEAVKETFIDLYNDGKIYKGSRIINWCPSCKTALSDAEVEYEEQEGNLWYIKYPFTDTEGYVEVATTRPETMLGDTAVAVNPEDERYKDMIGKTVHLPLTNRDIPIIADEYVDMEYGTGAVKITPAHDPNDYEVGKRHNLEEINIMNEDGTLNKLAGEKFEGFDRYEARDIVVEELENSGLLTKTEDLNHNVGTCYRCHTTVETMTSEQWFVAMQELAKRAIEVVENGETKFIPDRFSKTYFNWMNNIRDWCISRQLWWGHQIPAYYCEDCDEIIVGKEKPEVCPKCGSTNIVQDEDVLDTWFSSALWPFSTLGWPEETEDFNQFFPNNTLVTGYDIIFFWVARMIFMSLYNTDQTPFENIYIHGLIRDKNGLKMSKSLGNGIDPLQVIKDYSADALRFAIITGNAAGNDVRMSDEKLEWGRNFLNKLWNASRFVLMNIDDEEIPEEEVIENLEGPDKWILSRLNTVIGEVTENMDKYELGLAAQKVYDFTWNEFCDWYIEFVKPRFNSENEKSKKAAYYTLSYVLKNILKLLHPVIPFITEEIYSYIPGTDQALIIEKWPEVNPAYEFKAEEENIQKLIEIVRAIRNIRSNYEVPNKKEVDVFINSSDEELSKLEESKEILNKLARVSKLSKLPEGEDLDKYATAVVNDVEIYILLEDLVDREKEIERLTTKLNKLTKEVEKSNKKLSNEGFLSKAPEAVVNKEKRIQQELTEEINSINKRLESLK